jgi:serine/threonine protein kinase/Tol biopolymer transport system component
MGEVYRARDTRLGRDVAIKVLPAAFSSDPDRLRRFEHEARAAAALNHPNICTIYDVGRAGEISYIAMELLTGETLADRLRRGALSIAEWCELAIALSDAVGAAHTGGTLHRDLKPANIVVTSRGPKVLDFGLAKPTAPRATDATVSRASLTSAGTMVGTVAYMSPEQVRDEPLDVRSDLFSLGLVLYEAATGRPAFTGPTSAAISAGILHESPASPTSVRPEWPPQLQDIVLKAIEKDREVRYQTAADLLADLRRAHGDIASGASAAPTQSRYPVRFALAVAAALVTMAGIGYVMSRRPAAPVMRGPIQLESVRLTDSLDASRPAISPDGKFVAYIKLEGVDTSLWIRQIASGSNVRIVPAAKGVKILNPTVSPDGSFVDYQYVTDAEHSLWRVPFLGGAAKPLVDSVSSSVGWSSDGKQMAFLRTGLAAGTTMLMVAAADGTGERVVATRGLPESFYSMRNGDSAYRPAWSLDGRTLAVFAYVTAPRRGSVLSFVEVATGKEQVISDPFLSPTALEWLDEVSLVVNNAGQLWRVAYPSGARTPLTNDVNTYVGISLDRGTQTLVTTREEMRTSLWMVDLAGQATVALNDVARSRAVPGVAWLGERLLYGKLANNQDTIAALSPDGTSQDVIANASWPVTARDGKQFVFSRTADGETSLWRADLSGRGAEPLTRGRMWASMTPEGGTVVFPFSRGGAQSMWSISIAGGEPVQLSTEFAFSSDLTRDGRTLAFASVPGARNDPIYVICDMPGCTSRRSLKRRRDITELRWMPDGQAIAFIEPRETNIWLQPIDGGAPHQFTHFTDRQIDAMAWSPDGRRLAVSRRLTSTDVVMFRGFDGGTR